MGNYVLSELDGATSKFTYRADRLIPYHARRTLSIDVLDFLERTQALVPDDSHLELAPNEPDLSSNEDFDHDT